MQRAASQGVAVREELEIARADGRTLHMYVSAAPLYNDHGQVRGSAMVARANVGGVVTADVIQSLCTAGASGLVGASALTDVRVGGKPGFRAVDAATVAEARRQRALLSAAARSGELVLTRRSPSPRSRPAGLRSSRQRWLPVRGGSAGILTANRIAVGVED